MYIAQQTTAAALSTQLLLNHAAADNTQMHPQYSKTLYSNTQRPILTMPIEMLMMQLQAFNTRRL
jgi:hypothetical protein